MPKVMAIVNQKGGVGKTTTSINLATALSVMNKKVLIVDLDPQGNSSTGLGIEQKNRKVTVYHLLMSLNSIEEAITRTNLVNLDIILSNPNLAAAEIELTALKQREYILSALLKLVAHLYEYIIIDCPPSLNLLTINALVAAHEVLIPMQCDFFSLEGLSHLLQTIESIKKRLNPQIKITGILFTMYDKRSRLTEEVEQDVRNCLGDLVFDTTIPRNIKLSEAPSHGKPGVIYDHKCAGSLAYMQLTREILDKENWQELN